MPGMGSEHQAHQSQHRIGLVAAHHVFLHTYSGNES
jgi:hypothetical protein